jgi:DNA-binding CsgD family transcriptional regulator
MFTQQLNSDHATDASASIAPCKPDLERVWQALISGRYRVVDRGVTAHNHYFKIDPVPDSAAHEPLSERKLHLLVAVLLGHRQKAFAIEAACAPSTVTAHLGDCLEAFGFHRQSHRLPLLLVVMAHALFGKLPLDCVQVAEHQSDAGTGWTVHSYRPEILLSQKLSESEAIVVSYRIQGETYAQIARQRGTSARTVANQIASAHHKLRVSGRAELLCYLASQLQPSTSMAVT